MDQNTLLLILWAIAAIAIFIKAILPYKKTKNYDGAIRVNTSNPEKDTYTLELYIPFGELEDRENVTFEIVHE